MANQTITHPNNQCTEIVVKPVAAKNNEIIRAADYKDPPAVILPGSLTKGLL
jgi:hypothetical protein